LDTNWKTWVIACCDDRVQDPLNELCKQIGREDGVDPYRNTVFGACLPYVVEESSDVFVNHAQAAFEKVTRIVIVDHDGGENEPGCLAYQYQYSEHKQTPLDPGVEDLRHRANLVAAERVFRDALAAFGRNPDDVVIDLYVDHHDTGLQRVELPGVSAPSGALRSS
jgi:hypothetical protein